MLVTDCDSSNPIAGAVVTIDQVSFNANSNGYALFAGLLQGYTNAYAQAQGYISGETEVFVTGASTVVQPICLEKKNKPVDNPPSIEVFRTPSGEVKNSDKIVLQATSSDDSSVKFTGIYYAIGANPFVKSSCVGSYCKTSIGPLNSDTIVTYYADAKDDSGKTTQSAFESFQVSKPASTPTPYDSIAPQVEAVRSPSNAVTEKDDILLAALSFDESGIKSTRISYRIGGAATQARSCSANRCEVNLGKLPVGTTVKYFGSAVDSSAQENYKETSAESFVVQNSFTDSKPPQVSIQRIPAGDVAAGKAIQVIASATDESRVKSTTIKYSLGGTGEEYFTCSTNYCLKSIGPFLKGDVVTYYASAVDEASNEGVSAIGSFTVGAASSGSRDGTSPFPTGSATVYVNDCGTQAPIGGARVIVGNNAGETDSSGKAVLPSVNAGTVLLNVSKSGYAQKLDSFSVFNGQNSVKTICLDKSGINLASPSCKITLAQTNPVVGESVAASVSFSDFEQAPASASVDCGDGSVKQVLCTSNSCPTTCSYPGQGTYLAKASIGQTACEQASVTAEREPAVLLVKVRDVNSQPIEGAFVDLEGFNTLRTNNAGEAAYSLSAGEYSYSISKDSFDSISAAATVIGGQANAVTKTLYKSSCAFAAEIAATTSCNANPFIAQVRVRNNDAAAQEYGISFSNANGVDKLALNPGEEKLFPLTSILPSDSAGSILSSVSISDTRGCTVNLELPLCSQSGIRLSAPATVKTTGGKRECTQVLVENKGSVDTVVSMASSPQDWSAGFDANEFVLRGQESRFVAFCASTQSGYSGEKTFIVSAYSNLNSDATSVGFDVLGQNDFSATNASTCTLAYPNSQFVKQIDLSNNYGESGDYYLAATSSSDYLSAQFAQEKVYNFAKYSTRPVYLNVGTKDLPSGSIAVTVELFEKDSGSRVYSKDYCFTSEARVNSNIFFEKNNLVLARATQRNTPLVIENNGNQDLVYVIEPASSLVTLDNYNITVPKNYRKVVTAFIKTKDSDELGLRKIPVKVYYVDQSGNKQLNAQLELNFEIVSESQSVAPLVAGEGLSIAKVESRLLPADGQVSLAVTLGNENYFEASSINLYATNLPSGVKARQKPPFSIKAYENKAEYVSLEAVNAVPGTYEIKVVAQYGTATASKFVSIKIGDKNKTVAIRLSEPIVKSIAENGLVKANVSINVSSNELSQTGFNYAIVDLENWTITATPPYSILDPKETQAVVFSLEKQNAENRDYNATLQITTNDGRVTLSPITIPVKSSGLFTGFFSISAQDSALSILILAALLLAGGVYYQARQNASRARQIGG
ncbi:hypothetical protein HY993_01850 [Candidatus Micrarchaeota archaeon]|nr:hypothetical protein [Candidatus Micrarchaeota archaeon]